MPNVIHARTDARQKGNEMMRANRTPIPMKTCPATASGIIAAAGQEHSLGAIRAARCSLTGVALVGAMLIPAGPAQARPTITRLSVTHTETFTASLEGCLPGDLVGTPGVHTTELPDVRRQIHAVTCGDPPATSALIKPSGARVPKASSACNPAGLRDRSGPRARPHWTRT